MVKSRQSYAVSTNSQSLHISLCNQNQISIDDKVTSEKNNHKSHWLWTFSCGDTYISYI